MLTYNPELAVAHLRAVDSILAGVIDSVGPFTLETRDGAFRELALSIFSQQLAQPAADAILNRTLNLLFTDTERNLVRRPA